MMKYLRRGILVLLSLALGLIIGELGARFLLYRLSEPEQNLAWSRIEQGLVDSEVPDPATLGDMIRVSEHRRIIYQLKPDMSTHFQGVLVETNKMGFRGDDFEDGGGYLIVGLGDSHMFGWGVPLESTYLARIGDSLSRQLNTKVEVLNTAVPGYNTCMEVATLEQRLLEYEPDLVILGVVGNDLSLPRFLSKFDDLWSFERSYLVQLFSNSTGGPTEFPPRARAGRTLDRLGSDPNWVHARYRDLVGAEAFSRSLERLAELQARHGFQLLVIHRNTSLDEDTVLDNLGIARYDIVPDLVDYLQARGSSYSEIRDSELVLSPQDTHPSETQHLLISEAVTKHLLESGLVLKKR